MVPARTTTRWWPRSATTSPAACPSRSPIPARVVELVYVDDVVAAFMDTSTGTPPGVTRAGSSRSFTDHGWRARGPIRVFRAMRENLVVADFADPLARRLYATYLAYLPPDDLAYSSTSNRLARHAGRAPQAPHFGQIFVSRTNPGVTRGNHYHHTKVEKFWCSRARR